MRSISGHRDEFFKIFINATSKERNIPSELRSFLDYLLGELPNSTLTDRIQMEVDKSRNNKSWEVSYMTLEDKYREKFEEGKQECRQRNKKADNNLSGLD